MQDEGWRQEVPHLVCLEEVDGSRDVKLAGHKELDSRGLGDETSAVRLLPAAHLTQELLNRLEETHAWKTTEDQAAHWYIMN